MRNEISTPDYSFRPDQWLLGGQMMFVAFGALVLVPPLTGLDPNVALFTAGAGTLVFQACTKGKVPVFLASSFVFIAPIIYGVQTWGIASTLGGLAAAGLLYVVLSFVVRIKGSGFLERYLPRVVTGPVIMVIGLILAPVGVIREQYSITLNRFRFSIGEAVQPRNRRNSMRGHRMSLLCLWATANRKPGGTGAFAPGPSEASWPYRQYGLRSSARSWHKIAPSEWFNMMEYCSSPRQDR
jgi:hypothetical protein